MQEIVSKRNWDSKLFDTGRIDKDDRPIYGTKIQNGLHDIEPDGKTFIDINTKFMDYEVGVSTDIVIRNRCGEVRVSDTGSESKDLAKIKTKRNCGVSLKLKGIRTYGPFFDDLKSCYYNTDDGVILRYYPHYKGVSIVVEIANPQTASNVYSFSLKEYGCDYTYEEIDGAIKCISSTGEDDIWIKATYAVDANEDYGSVHMRLGSIVNGLQEVEKVISPVWLGNAIGPVLSDPDVIIDDVSGTLEDTRITGAAGFMDLNYGGAAFLNFVNNAANDVQNDLLRVDLTAYSGITVTLGKFGIDVYFKNTQNPALSIHRMLRAWGEGNRNGVTATAGQSSWNDYFQPNAWTTAGALSNGNDRQTSAESTTTITGTNSDFALDLTTASVQDDIDNPGNNHGYGVYNTNQVAGSNAKARSSESGVGNKPYFYMEYTEGVVAFSHIAFSIYDKQFNAFKGLSGKNTII